MAHYLEQLRLNDPGDADIVIWLRNSSDAKLSEALRANKHVKKITLAFHDVGNTNWNSLLRVIATHAILDEVGLMDSFESAMDSFDSAQRNPPKITNRF